MKLDGVTLRRVNVGGGITLAAAVVYLCAAAPLFGPDRRPERFNDYFQTYWHSKLVVERQTYTDGFAYPLPSVLLRYYLGRLGFEASGHVWIAILAGSTLLSFRLLIQALGLGRHRLRWAIALAAFLPVRYYLEWDLKCLNCNLFYLCLVLLALRSFACGASGTCGFWAAASIAFKLYSVGLLAYFLLRRRWGEFFWTVIWLGVFFVVWPIGSLGFDGAVQASRSWWRQGSDLATFNHSFDFGAIISLKKTIGVLAKDEAMGGWIDAGSAALWHHTARAVWVALIVAYFALAHRSGRENLGDEQVSRDLVADYGVIALSLVAISPFLETFHVVPVIVPSMLFAALIVDPGTPRPLKQLMLTICIAGWLLLDYGPSGPMRGLGVYSHLILVLCGLVAVRGYPARQTATDGLAALEASEPPGKSIRVALTW